MAFARHFRDLSILQLDAHSDLRPEYEDLPSIMHAPWPVCAEHAPIVAGGIRSISKEEAALADPDRIFPAHQLYTDKSGYERAIDMLSEDVYITIDLDVLDPSLMPSTGTPEPGGPEYRELMDFLKEVACRKNVVGFDVVELCPSPVNKAPDFVAARIIYQLLSYVFCQPRRNM
jgi:agmatinase